MNRQTLSQRRALRQQAERAVEQAQARYEHAPHGFCSARYRELVKARTKALEVGPVRRLPR